MCTILNVLKLNEKKSSIRFLYVQRKLFCDEWQQITVAGKLCANDDDLSV